MSGFHFVFRHNSMFINFGELPHATILKLCGFVRVFNFPQSFWSFEDGNVHDLIMEFYGKDEVVVTIDGNECYHGDFDEAWNNAEYYRFFNDIIRELREARDDLDFEDQTEDQLDNLVRDVDYLDLFTDYLDEMSELDEQEERIQREEEEDAVNMVDDIEADTKTLHL